jgi:hypothetical protein
VRGGDDLETGPFFQNSPQEGGQVALRLGVKAVVEVVEEDELGVVIPDEYAQQGEDDEGAVAGLFCWNRWSAGHVEQKTFSPVRFRRPLNQGSFKSYCSNRGEDSP